MQNIHKLQIAALLFFLLLSSSTFGQFRDYDLKVGGKLEYLYPMTDFSSTSSLNIDSYLARVLARYELNYFFEAELSMGMGRLSENADGNGDYLKTDFFDIGGKVIFRPFDFDDYNPYAYIGAGIQPFEVVDFGPRNNAPDAKALALNAPVGVGVEYRLTDNWLLDGNIGWTYSTNDNLDKQWEGDIDDSYMNFGIGVTYVMGVNKDRDNDGLENEFERSIGTSFRDADTDGDGLNDGLEVNQYKTNPIKSDTDGDGLSDADELKNYKTDPNKTDTDDDGLNDGDELLKYGTDPFKADSDNDKLTDADEVNVHKTDPSNADSDGDKLSDFDEINVHKTNPLSADSDGDGLSDSVEINKYKSNPLKADTDGGTKLDGEEVKAGLNLLDASDDVAPVAPVVEVVEEVKPPVTFEPVYFELNSAKIGTEYELVLEKALKILKLNPDVNVEVQGHTDNTGSLNLNKELSTKRAEAVKSWLVKKGVDSKRFTTTGKDSQLPAATNDTDEGRAKNRRTTILPIGQK
ncbi:MAG: OmpA family protein [Bacteroidota bacterium]|nr:OmpA family protein [Bacteroidota bacterium]